MQGAILLTALLLPLLPLLLTTIKLIHLIILIPREVLNPNDLITMCRL